MKTDYLAIFRDHDQYFIILPKKVCPNNFNCKKCELDSWCEVYEYHPNPVQVFKGNHFLLLITEDLE